MKTSLTTLVVVLVAGCVAYAADPGAVTKKLTPPKLPAAPPGVEIQADIPYLPPDRQEKLDLYLPANRAAGTKSPAVVIIHGGGWTGGFKSASREFDIGTTLAKAGYVCASVEYDRRTGQNWPGCLLDCKNGVRFLRANAEKYGIDAEHIGTIGGSAGGHLALMVGYTWNVKELEPEKPYPGISDRVQACVNLYGITNLLTRQATEPDGTPNGKLRIGGLISVDTDPNGDARKLASPVFHVTRDCPPTLTLHGTADTTVDRDQATELDRKLTEVGIEHQTLLLPGAKHTFLLSDKVHDTRAVVVAFFDKCLKPGS